MSGLAAFPQENLPPIDEVLLEKWARYRLSVDFGRVNPTSRVGRLLVMAFDDKVNAEADLEEVWDSDDLRQTYRDKLSLAQMAISTCVTTFGNYCHELRRANSQPIGAVRQLDIVIAIASENKRKIFSPSNNSKYGEDHADKLDRIKELADLMLVYLFADDWDWDWDLGSPTN